MELPNPISQGSEFSILNASDSQILCPSDSLSLPSEPPEITNWFPNYRYESPTSDIFGDSICEDSEIENEKLRINDGQRAKEEDCLRGLEELEKKEKVLVGDDKREQRYLIENVDSLCSPSLLSEPIDLRNWFPSYAYESPALDTNDGFSDSVCEEREREGDGFDVEESNREINGDFQINRIRSDVESSAGLINYNNSCGDNKQEKQSFNEACIRSGAGNKILSDKTSICFESALKHCSKHAILQNHGTSTSKDVAVSNFELDDSQRTLNFSGGTGIMRCNAQSSSEKSCLGMENKKDSEEKGCEEADGFLLPESNIKSVLINDVSSRRPCRRCEDKENDGIEIANDGFVTTRKGRFFKASEGIRLETRKGNSKEADSITERKALAERTNFRLSSVTEITGKWKCPQKRKPNIGPPLKQLRLERWVHRL